MGIGGEKTSPHYQVTAVLLGRNLSDQAGTGVRLEAIRDQGPGKGGSARAAAGLREGRGERKGGASGEGLGRGAGSTGDAAPPPSSKRRRSCSRTNCSILFTVE